MADASFRREEKARARRYEAAGRGWARRTDEYVGVGRMLILKVIFLGPSAARRACFLPLSFLSFSFSPFCLLYLFFNIN